MLRAAVPVIAIAFAVGLGGDGSAASGTGALAQLLGTEGCLLDADAAVDDEDFPPELKSTCARVVALQGANNVVVTPDGRHVYVLSFDGNAVAAFSRTPVDGTLRQLGADAACLSEPRDGLPCAAGTALHGAADIAFSPDGRHAYVASTHSHAVVVLARDSPTGRLTQPTGEDGCVSERVTEETCAHGFALVRAGDVAVSADGRTVYLVSPGSDAIAIFNRNPESGRLTQLPPPLGCVSTSGLAGDPESPIECTVALYLEDVTSIAISADGRNVYTTALSAQGDPGAIAVFQRNPANGALQLLEGQSGCLSDTGNGGECADIRGVDGPFSVAISPDGRGVYVAVGFSRAAEDAFAKSGVLSFARDPTTGRLSQLPGTAGCTIETDAGDACADGRGLRAAQAVVVSPDGSNVYVAAGDSEAIAVFARNRATGALSQLPMESGCVSESGGECADGRGLTGVASLAVSPDGRNVYAPGYFTHTLGIFSRAAVESLVRLGTQLRPVAPRSGGRGSVRLELNQTTRRLCWSIKHRGVGQPTATHLHRVRGNVLVAVLGRRSGAGCVTLAARWVTALGRQPRDFFVDVHTAGHPLGALRGRLTRTAP